MGECREGHSFVVRGNVVIRWCPECAVFEVKVFAAEEGEPGVTSLLPEWAATQRLADDEWLQRTLTKHVTAVAATVRSMEDDERRGAMRLF